VDEFYRKRIERQLATLKQATQPRTLPVELNRSILTRAAAQTSVADISVTALAEVIADALNTQKREILEHVQRLFALAKTKASAGADDERHRLYDHALHKRLTLLESEVRQLRKKGGAS
jgi:hypothetical protein